MDGGKGTSLWGVQADNDDMPWLLHSGLTVTPLAAFRPLKEAIGSRHGHDAAELRRQPRASGDTHQ
ncbi:hypothetical protein [Streptomyces lydicus]|uniref:hypothetical protein n=1 Tax=Streptomyces lydicus TaxID=47763 RepID=UPI00378E5230